MNVFLFNFYVRHFKKGIQSWYNLYIWLTIASWCGSIPLTLGLIGRDGGLRTLVS